MIESARLFLILLCSLVFVSKNLFAEENFQQEVNFSIDVLLNDIENSLSGTIDIQYINNSPYKLDSIYFHLWPNAFKNNKTAYARQKLFLRDTEFHFSGDEKKGYIDSLDFSVDKLSAVFISEYQNNPDIGILILPHTLMPGDTINISTSFYVKIPEITDRFGHKNGTYYITHWFPKPAVFDKEGWHPMPYLSIGEFYQEFGNYRVNITLPKQYIVAASGELLNREELHRLENYARDCMNNVESRAFQYRDTTGNKTLNYISSNMIDFAWFASKEFIVHHDIVKIPDTDRYVHCRTFFSPENKQKWHNAIKYVKRSVILFSELIGEYPYANCIVVDSDNTGVSGMEYPGIVMASGKSEAFLERVIAHEIAHIWFYGILANNERKSPWIDEGFTSYYEQRYLEKFYPDKTLAKEIFGFEPKRSELNNLPARYLRELSWLILKKENLAQAPGLHSEEFSPINYFAMPYNRTVSAISTLETYMGIEHFDDMMRDFYYKYKFKHIRTEDIREHFENFTGEDLSWFFDDLIYDDKIPGYKIKKTEKDSIIIKNEGEIQIPLFLHIGDSLIISQGFTGSKKFRYDGNENIFIDKNFRSLDINRNNNYYFPEFSDRLKNIRFRFANIIDLPHVKQIGFLPLVGYNHYDGWMPGIAFYNSIIPKKTFEYQLLPLFGTRSLSLSGIFNFSFFIHPQNSMIREIELYSRGRRFSVSRYVNDDYIKLDGGAKLMFRTDPTTYHISELSIRNVSATGVWSDSIYNFQHLKYSFENNRVLNPYSLNLNLETSKSHAKAFIESKYRVSYSRKDKGLDLRLFAGTFIYNANDYMGDYRFRLSGISGFQDYLYDHLYIGRNEPIRKDNGDFWANQFVKNDGGFAIFTTWGQTNKWMLSLNMTTSLPLPFVHVYYNLALVADNKEYFALGDVFYEAGIELRIIKNFCSIYFPLLYSDKIKETGQFYFSDNYLHKVRFTLYLEKIDPFKIRNQFYKFY